MSLDSGFIQIDAFLFCLATILSFVSSFNSYVFHPLLVFLGRPTKEDRILLTRRRELVDQQMTMNMVVAFAKYSKLQREINAIDAKLEQHRDERSVNNLVTQMFIRYGLKVVLGAILFFISVYYRNTPVLVLEKRYNLFPFESTIGYPNKAKNTISVHMWIMCCSAVAYLIKS